MTNLIFDISNIAFRSMFIVGGYGSKTYTFHSQTEVDQLMRKITMDVSFLVRLVNPARIIFAFDSKSWRKKIDIEENDGYKANRTKAQHINWENVFNALSEFSEIMESNGMIVSKIENAEADDVTAMWVNELQYKQHQHVIIVSSDEDLRQLVQVYEYDNKLIFTTVFNPFSSGKAGRKLYHPNNFIHWLNETQEIDIWNLSTAVDVDKEDFKRIRDGEKVSLELVNGSLIAMRKVFCGDDGDNIPAIYTWIDKNNKEVRITNSKFEKIYEMIKDNSNECLTHEDLLNRKDRIFEAIKTISKTLPIFDIEKRLQRQIKLVILDVNIFPEEIVADFEAVKQSNLNKPKINFSNVNMHDLLQGTRYVREKKGTESNIFKEFDQLGKNAKPLF